ncbi:MAG: serine hydrolase [Bacteroidetes bacterium]|nr:MAG: serine hydrolase [Bacteroidota bacterium]
MKSIFSLLLIAFALWMQPLAAQNLSAEKLSAEFDRILSAEYKADGPGCTALVAQNGKIIYQKAFGMANIELDVPMRPEMVFRIGSISKQFTAIAILQLLEQGKLSLQDPITKYVPDYPMHGYTITLEHLLTHTSGIKNYTDMEEFGKIMRNDMTPEEMIAFFKNQPMDFAPGSAWNYSNSGYFLLGYVIEKVSGKTYPEYVEELIFKPLGMKNSLYGDDAKLIKNRAAGYQGGENGPQNALVLSMTLPYAAGSLQSTVGDLFIWHQALHAGKLVKKETLQKAFTEYKLSNGEGAHYGYGWFLGDLQGSATIEHSGGINGFLTDAVYLPAQDVFVAVFSNSEAKDPGTPATKIAAWAIGKPYSYKEMSLSEQQQQEYTGVYETESGEQRIISIEKGVLYSRRTGGSPFVIRAYEKDKFFFDESLATLEFKREGKQIVQVISSQRNSPTLVWKKTDKPIPVQKEVSIGEKELAAYVGRYELAPTFSITITQEGGRLFAQATGQGKNEVFAEKPDRFFFKVVDAQIGFFKNAAGQVDRMILYQNGQEMPGKKVQ